LQQILKLDTKYKTMSLKQKTSSYSLPITEQIMMIKGGENRAVHFDFLWQRAPRLKNTVDPALALHKELR